MRRGVALAVVALGSVIAVGCGEEQASKAKPAPTASQTTYETTVRTIHADMNGAMAAAFGSSSLDESLIRDARTTAQDATAEMSEVKVPARYGDAHEEYVKGLDTFVDILSDVEGQVDDPNVARRHLGDKRFTTGVGHLERASRLYSTAGLDLDARAAGG